ncbi:hypothetical protein NHX12_025233 [Muraenolepis orangiensis]|uniref:Formin-like protein n=1 Tax=Muraenolepis orangiensis TaxID=630683 RepID=A0A9Q0EKT6_9TELE|nr:hypothetical protein NHX12_025233 [Muraenolepis orangiensis]
MNFRVHLQFEFTCQGLDAYLESLRGTESERLQVQVQAYLDNLFDVAALLEDAELSSRLEEVQHQCEERVSQLENKLMKTTEDSELIKERLREACLQVEALQQREREAGQDPHERTPSGQLDLQVVSVDALLHLQNQKLPHWSVLNKLHLQNQKLPHWSVLNKLHLQNHKLPHWSVLNKLHLQNHKLPHWSVLNKLHLQNHKLPHWNQTLKDPFLRKPIQTKYRMPLLNWQALKRDQVEGTVFNELDDDHLLGTRSQTDMVDLSIVRGRVVHKTPSKVSLLEPNRAKNLAITLRKAGTGPAQICTAIETYNQEALNLDFLELLERFMPSDYELKLIQKYESDGRPLEELGDEDRFMVHFSKIPRLAQRISTLAYMGNFPSTIVSLQSQLKAVIAASESIQSSTKLKKILEIILAFGNYMNSSKRSAVYGFRLQSLDLLLETKSTDRKLTLLHFIVDVIHQKYPELCSFHTELHLIDKAAQERGMEVTRNEFAAEAQSAALSHFLSSTAAPLDAVVADTNTAQEAYGAVVEYFGEDPRTTTPSVFFPVFARFIKAYKQAERDNELRRRQQDGTVEPPSISPKPKFTTNNKVPMGPGLPQMELLEELKKRQSAPLVRERKDGAIEDIITDLRNQPYRRADGGRRSAKWKTSQQLQVSSDISL